MSKIDLKKLSRQIIPIIKQHDVRKAALFGSMVRGEADRKSDIDILVDLPHSKTLLDVVALEQDLKKKIGRQVDVVTYNALHPRLRDRVLAEQQIFYERR